MEVICYVCGEYASEVWTVVLKDDREVREFSGHFKCVSELQDRINNVNNLDKKKVKKVIEELGLD
ncbi:hypothetical protein [Bacillus xiapuensis]|uniref:Uncharacterized protein n=1 Tax=Bacillus xiapuensis TaxID=2014075 RepID=A0ABU6N871_9BACI|nr:hypothetical protein [Bacillus xiapuensis]